MAQMELLSLVQEHPGARSDDLASLLHLAPNSVSTLTNAMTGAGMLDRSPGATDRPSIDPAHQPPGYGAFASFHPTFLYESLWCLGVAALLIWADHRFTLGHGRAFALYVAAYTVGRAWIESCASTPQTTSSVCASTTGPPWWSSPGPWPIS